MSWTSSAVRNRLHDPRCFHCGRCLQPVKLKNEQKTELLRVIEVWGERTQGGMRGLPEGIFALRNALIDDLGDPQ